MATIDMTPENRPYFDALFRVVAGPFGRDFDAEDVLANVILEMLRRRKETTKLREIMQQLLLVEWDDDGGGEIIYVDGHALAKLQAKARALLTEMEAKENAG